MAANTSVPVVVASMSVAIPQTRLRRGGAATVSSSNAFTLPPPSPQYHFPPTPPNSISPSLPPVQKEKNPLDSDVDVEMVVEISAAHGGGGGGGVVGVHSAAEAAGTITPGLLAKYHIPDILLRHGPLAIRHLTAHLISSIPGFSSIPPAKQRRLVVGALEGRGGGGVMEGKVGVGERAGGGVIFEKVGWGRWDARVTGQPPRDRGSPSCTPAVASVATMNVSQSYTGESGIFIQSSEEEDGGGPPTDLDSDMQDHNDDLDMSLDSSDEDSSSCSSSDGDSEDIVLDDNRDDDGDVTDEEDWALIGAAMLRRQATSPITSDGSTNLANATAASYDCSWSVGPGKHVEDSRAREEREAVEALVKLSSI